MCTVMTTAGLFGRTMDFPPRTPWHLTFLPAGFQWRPASGGRATSNRYRVLGGMRHFAGHYLVGDGINSAGLICAELFFPVAATYPAGNRLGAQLTPQDFIMWILGQHATVAEVASDLARIQVVDDRWFDGNHYPFHWLLQDASGSFLIEPLAGQLQLKADSAAVLTNTPSLEKQLALLNHRLGRQGVRFSPSATAAYSGPWPSGGNSAERFQRAALARWQRPPRTAAEMASFLQTVTVPHTPRHANNYTHYRAVVDREQQDYYFVDLHHQRTIKKCLGELALAKAVTFE